MWCKAEFSASLLQSSVSRDPSEIILICWFAKSLKFYEFNENWVTFLNNKKFLWIESSIEQHLCISGSLYCLFLTSFE